MASQARAQSVPLVGLGRALGAVGGDAYLQADATAALARRIAATGLLAALIAGLMFVPAALVSFIAWTASIRDEEGNTP